MKTKIFYFLIASLFVLSSCSGDTDGRDIEPIKDIKTEPKKEDQVLLRKMIQTHEDGTVDILNYKYDGNKIISAIDSNEEGGVYWIYNQDLITKMIIKLADETILQENTYIYDANKKLSIFLRVDPELKEGYKEVYTYNADNTITVKAYSGDDKSQTVFQGTSVITIIGGEVSKIDSNYSPSFVYTYDTKYNPHRNILGLDKTSFADGEASGNVHNIISQKIGDGVTKTSKITYNADGYPTKSFDNFEDAGTTTEYFY
jgi:hypothetical protein